MEEGRPRQTVHYLTENGADPIWKWLKRIRDSRSRAKIEARITRIEVDGHFGDCVPVGGGVFELRFLGHGPGFRIYLAEDSDNDRIVLLLGGDKSTQRADVVKAKEYWRDYNDA